MSLKQSREIPSYPGTLVRKAPIPPKYLLQVIETNDGIKNKLIQVKGTPPIIRPKLLNEPDAPILAKYSNITPQRDHTTKSHFYPPRQEYIPPDIKKNKNKTKNSLVDVKSSSSSSSSSSSLNKDENNNQHTVFPALAKNPTIPRPFVPPSAASYVGGPLMHAREASGKILGTGNFYFYYSYC